MNIYITILIILFVTICLKFLINLDRYIKTKKYYKEFHAYIFNNDDAINYHKLQSLDLFKKAGVKDSKYPVTQPAGFNKLASFEASVFENFPSKQEFVAITAAEMFEAAIGVYKSQMFECINPVYWLEAIVFLPKSLLLYIGLDQKTISFRILNITLTFAWWVICAILAFAKPYIHSIVNHIVRKF